MLNSSIVLYWSMLFAGHKYTTQSSVLFATMTACQLQASFTRRTNIHLLYHV